MREGHKVREERGQPRSADKATRGARDKSVGTTSTPTAMQRNVADVRYKAGGDLRPFWRPEVNLAVMEAGGDAVMEAGGVDSSTLEDFED